MTTVSPILRSWYPPVILRSDWEIKINQSVENIILRTEEVRVNNQLWQNILKTRSDVHVKITQSSLVLRSSDVWSHNHDLRYYTRAIMDTLLGAKVAIEDIVNNLTTDESEKPLSAAQGVVLKGLIDQINTLLTSNDVSLDELQEIVNYIKENREDLDSLGISSIIGLQTALDGKVPNTRTLTINGVTYDLSADRSFTIPTATPGWSTGDIQINKASALYGVEFFNFDETTGELRAYWALGTEKVLNGWFTGNANNWTLNTWWTYSGNRVWHTANGTGVLTQSIQPVVGELYKVTFEIQDLTVWSVTVTMWGVTLGTYSANGVYTVRVRATNTSALTFTPTNTARLYIDNVSAKRYQLWQISTGKGVFNDKLKVSLTASNYLPGTVDHLEIENPSWEYSHITGKFGTLLKQSISFGSGGDVYVNTSSVNGLILKYGSTISSSVSPYAYLGTSGLLYYWYGRFSGAVVAWSTSQFNAKLAVLGSKMEQIRYVNEQGYTLSDDTQYLLNTTGLNWCTGTPTTVCSSFGTNQASCDAKAYLGCAFTIQYYCSDFNWDPSTCSSMGCSPAESSCSGAGDEYSCLQQDDSYGGNCAWNYYSESCSSFDQSACEANSGSGCSTNFSSCYKQYYDCAQYNGNESGCNEHSGDGCSYDSESGNCNGWNYSSCGGGGDCSSHSEMDCESYSYFTNCSGDVSYYLCEWNYTNWNCDGGAYGLCGGTAQCSAISVEATCNAESGCAYTTTMWVLLPNSNTFYVALSTGLTQATGASREYKAMVVGTGSVVLTSQGDDVFENWATTKTLSTNYKYSITFFWVPGNCTDFGSEETCSAQSGCSPNYDEGSMFTSCSGTYIKYKRWYVGTMS